MMLHAIYTMRMGGLKHVTQQAAHDKPKSCVLLQDFNDAMLTVYLSGITNGIEAVNDIVEKVSTAFESKSTRRRGML